MTHLIWKHAHKLFCSPGRWIQACVGNHSSTATACIYHLSHLEAGQFFQCYWKVCLRTQKVNLRQLSNHTTAYSCHQTQHMSAESKNTKYVATWVNDPRNNHCVRNPGTVRTMQTPVEKRVAAVTDVVVPSCCGIDGSLLRMSRMWFTGTSENICTKTTSQHNSLNHPLISWENTVNKFWIWKTWMLGNLIAVRKRIDQNYNDNVRQGRLTANLTSPTSIQ